MELQYPRIITDKTIKRYITYLWKHNKKFVCHKCGRPFKVGDKLFRVNSKGSKYYCENCFRIMWIDIPDEILNDNEQKYIESGKWD